VPLFRLSGPKSGTFRPTFPDKVSGNFRVFPPKLLLEMPSERGISRWETPKSSGEIWGRKPPDFGEIPKSGENPGFPRGNPEIPPNVQGVSPDPRGEPRNPAGGPESTREIPGFPGEKPPDPWRGPSSTRGIPGFPGGNPRSPAGSRRIPAGRTPTTRRDPQDPSETPRNPPKHKKMPFFCVFPGYLKNEHFFQKNCADVQVRPIYFLRLAV
jgi:hypothetical protein